MSNYNLNQGSIIIENKRYKSYGISCGEKVVANDISTNKTFVSNLVKSFNKYRLDMSQIIDVIEDIL